MYSIISSYLRLFRSSRARGKREIGSVISRRKRKQHTTCVVALSLLVFLSKGGLFKGRKREKNETTRAEKPPRRRVHGTPTAKTTPPACGDRRLARDSSRLRPALFRASPSPRIATRKNRLSHSTKKLVDHVRYRHRRRTHTQRKKKKFGNAPPNASTRRAPHLSACSANFALNTRSSRSIFFFLSLSSLDRTLWSRDVVCTLLYSEKEEEESLVL